MQCAHMIRGILIFPPCQTVGIVGARNEHGKEGGMHEEAVDVETLVLDTSAYCV